MHTKHDDSTKEEFLLDSKAAEPEESAESGDSALDTDIIVSVRVNRRKLFSKETLKLIFSPILKTLDGIQTDYSDRSGMRKSLIAMLKLKTPICVLLALVILMSGCYLVWKSDNTVSTEMSLNYEESAYGLNPNSTRFNVYDVSSPEVVRNMLSYCGIDPDSVDVNSVIDCISVSPVNAKSFSEDNLFISTTFKIKMKQPSSIKDVDVKTLLGFLCKAYKDNLYMNYTENRSILSFNIDKFNDEEYLVIADLLDLKAQQIEKYLNYRVKQNKSFTEETSDTTFKSLSQRVEDIRDYDIAKYRSFVKEAGCSFDKARYTRSLSYVNLIKGIDYSKNIAAYSVYNNGIKIYNESMINTVMIPSIDTEKNSYYMSRTKTGMDYMAKQANDFLLKAQEIEKETTQNKVLITKVNESENKNTDVKKADKMIEDIRLKFSDLSKQIEKVDKAYIKYKTKDYLTFKTTNASLMQKLQPATLLVIAFAFILAVYALIWLKFRLADGGKKQ